MHECEKYLEMMSAMIDGELSDADTIELMAHIRICPACEAVYDAFRAISGDLSSLSAAPEGLCSSVMDQLKKPQRINWQRYAALAACLALVCASALHFLPDRAPSDSGYVASAMGEIHEASPKVAPDELLDAIAPESAVYGAGAAFQGSTDPAGRSADGAVYVNGVMLDTTNTKSATLNSDDASYEANEDEMLTLLSNLEYSKAATEPELEPDIYILLGDGNCIDIWETDDGVICRLNSVVFIPSGDSETILSLISGIIK